MFNQLGGNIVKIETGELLYKGHIKERKIYNGIIMIRKDGYTIAKIKINDSGEIVEVVDYYPINIINDTFENNIDDICDNITIKHLEEYRERKINEATAFRILEEKAVMAQAQRARPVAKNFVAPRQFQELEKEQKAEMAVVTPMVPENFQRWVDEQAYLRRRQDAISAAKPVIPYTNVFPLAKPVIPSSNVFPPAKPVTGQIVMRFPNQEELALIENGIRTSPPAALVPYANDSDINNLRKLKQKIVQDALKRQQLAHAQPNSISSTDTFYTPEARESHKLVQSNSSNDTFYSAKSHNSPDHMRKYQKYKAKYEALKKIN